MPFGLNARQKNAWMYEGDGMKLMREFYDKYNIINFPAATPARRWAAGSARRSRRVADLKGLKIRIGGFAGKVLERSACVPQKIPGGDIYPALEKGTIDAAEWVGPYDDEKLGFNKVAQYYYYPGWWEGGPQLDFFINTRRGTSCRRSTRRSSRPRAAHAHVDMLAKYDAQNPAALKRLVGGGTKLRPLPEGHHGRRATRRRIEAVRASSARRTRRSRRSTKTWSSSARDQLLWFRVAEDGFDNFMHTIRSI